MRQPGRALPHPILARIAFIALLLVLWEVFGRIGSDLFIAPVSKVIGSGSAIFEDPAVRNALLTTAWELALAFALSVAIGLCIGLAVASSGFTLRSFYPLVLLIYAIPQVTVLPLFILYFGSGPASKIAFGVSHGLFPIAINVVSGVQGIPSVLLASARSMGASRWLVFRRITLPYLIPSLFTGMRLATSATLLGVLLAELYVSSGGIGHYTSLYSENFQPDRLFALIGALALMAIMINETMRSLERRSSSWRQQ
ncbi:MAG: ABC transporter permease [Hyphomicrobiaceae bacterium]